MKPSIKFSFNIFLLYFSTTLSFVQVLGIHVGEWRGSLLEFGRDENGHYYLNLFWLIVI